MSNIEIPSDPLQTQPQHSLLAVNIFPGITEEVFETTGLGMDALVMISDMGGGVPEQIIPIIGRFTEAGSAVFLMRDAAELGADYNNYGKVHLTDQPLVNAIEAGAVNLNKANATNFPEVIAAITKGLDEGLRGKDLQATVLEQFSLGHDEIPPSIRERTLTREYWHDYDQRLRDAGVGGLPDGVLDRALADIDELEKSARTKN